MDKNEIIKNFFKNQDHKKAIHCFDYLKDYIATLEQRNADLQAIVADPEGEVARCRAEVRELHLKLQLQDAYSINTEERKAGKVWFTEHAERCHCRKCDYHWEVSPFSLGIAVDIVCDECGEKYCARTD